MKPSTDMEKIDYRPMLLSEAASLYVDALIDFEEFVEGSLNSMKKGGWSVSSFVDGCNTGKAELDALSEELAKKTEYYRQCGNIDLVAAEIRAAGKQMRKQVIHE